MLKRILMVVAALVVVLLVVIAMQPSKYHVERTAKMAAAPAAVFAQVNDFHNWDAWSPWAKIDPAAKITFEGPAAGKGAMFSWDGNDDVGAGKMTILDSHAPESIHIQLDFLKPFACTAATQFAFKADGAETSVTWSMDGDNNFMGKAFGLFCNMDKMIGADYEKGLASMKSIVEAPKR